MYHSCEYRRISTLGRTGWLQDLSGVKIKIADSFKDIPKIRVPHMRLDRNKIMEKFNYDFDLEERVLRDFQLSMRLRNNLLTDDTG